MTAILHHGFIYLFIGAFAGLMAGLFGVGGGLIVVPGLLFIFQHNHVVPNDLLMQVAVGTSLTTMIITTTASIKAHHQQGQILWSTFHKLLPGILCGTIFGSIIASWIPTQWLALFFAVFLLSMSVKMLFDARTVTHHQKFPQNWVNYLITFLIGSNSGLLGVGGGLLVVPYLTYCGIEARKISALSNLCAFSIALIGALLFIITGYTHTSHNPYLLGYVYWPAVLLIGLPSSLMAPIGARLNYKLPIHLLRYGFVGILVITAMQILF